MVQVTDNTTGPDKPTVTDKTGKGQATAAEVIGPPHWSGDYDSNGNPHWSTARDSNDNPHWNLTPKTS